MRKFIAAAALISVAVFGFSRLSHSGAAVDKEKSGDKELFKQVELFSDSLAIVSSEYVDQVKAKDLIYGALKGMLASLDPHSQFMDPDTYNELKVDTEGKFGGLGIEITIKDGLLTIITPIEDTPAWKAGLKSNDKIVKIDNELTRDITLTDAVKKMRGKVGDPVTLTILRESEKKLLEFKIVRGVIKIQDIKTAKIIDDKIGYIRLIEFRENTSKELDKALDALQKQGMSALILDLRNNPGGLLDVAVDVAGKFIERNKLVVSTKSRREGQNMEFRSNASKPLTEVPMAILINEGSASGSEIVAGALQDYRRALIIGTKSFGKGSVQTIVPLTDGSALRLTTSKYYTPLKKEIHGKGVMPDLVIEETPVIQPAKEDAKDVKAEEVFEQIEKEDTTPPAGADKEKDKDNYKLDNQLSRAVDVLKAVRLLRK